jgi:hypothetical protein
MARTPVIAIIEARSGKKVEYESDEAKNTSTGKLTPFKPSASFQIVFDL